MSFRSPISSSRAWGWHSTPRFVATAADPTVRIPATVPLATGTPRALEITRVVSSSNPGWTTAPESLHRTLIPAAFSRSVMRAILGEGNLHAAVLELDRAELDPLRGLLDPAGPQGDVHLRVDPHVLPLRLRVPDHVLPDRLDGPRDAFRPGGLQGGPQGDVQHPL